MKAVSVKGAAPRLRCARFRPDRSPVETGAANCQHDIKDVRLEVPFVWSAVSARLDQYALTEPTLPILPAGVKAGQDRK